jgi:D-alanyl-D-alanine carboxypeptidase/D-alanyl-D-alanine-endopeptidase (penicillin-binding protein 4)
LKITNKTPIISIFTLLLTILLSSGCGDKIKPQDISLQIPENRSDEKYFPEFHPSKYGYIIYDTVENRVIKSHNSKKSFIPASVTKLFTAVYALEIFEKDDKYITEVSYTGKIRKGELQGNLYIKGSGDPTLTVADLADIAKQLKADGIIKIAGSFFYDESLFPAQDVIDESMSPEAKYNTGLSALTLNNNHVYSVQLQDKERRVTGYDFVPSTPLNSASTYSGPYSYRLVRYRNISGKETWSFPEKRLVPRQYLPVKNPGLFTAWTFKEICKIHGITIPDPEPGISPSGRKKLTLSESGSISSIVKDILHNSNNTSAELIARTSIVKARGEFQGSMEPVENFYQENFKQIDWSGFTMGNGSGLTPAGRVTPEQTAALLIYADKNRLHGRKMDYYLPMSGLEGTLTGRMDNPETAMRVYAKTGTIFYASALSGFFYSESGKKYIFSIFISDLGKRSAYDNSTETGSNIYEAVQWSRKAEYAMDRFIAENIRDL